MHALVLLAGATTAAGELQTAHEGFIGTLEAEHRVVLGGGLIPPVVGYDGAYLVRCADLDEAGRIAHRDPLVQQGGATIHVVEWLLVGVDPQAVDREALLFPQRSYDL